MYSTSNLNLNINNSFNEAINWFGTNGLCLNANKTQEILFSLRQVAPSEVSTAKLLGIVLDSKLTWNPHIDGVCKRLARVIHLLRHLKTSVPKEYLKISYYAFFNSILNYGIHIWGNSTNINRVLKLQRTAI